MRLPPSSGGQSSKPNTTSFKDIIDWVKGGKSWKPIEQAALINLINNYIGIFVAQDDMRKRSKEFASVAENWEQAMMKLGISIDILSRPAAFA